MQPFHAPLAVNAQAGSTAGRGSGGLAASAGRRREAAEQSGPRGRGRGLRLWLSAELQLHAVLEAVRAVHRRQGRWAVAGRLALQVRLRLLHLREVEPLRAVPHDPELRRRLAVPDRVVEGERAIVPPVPLATAHAVVDPEGEARVRVECVLAVPGRGVDVEHSDDVVLLDHLVAAGARDAAIRLMEDRGPVFRGMGFELAADVREADAVLDQRRVAVAVHAADGFRKHVEKVLVEHAIAHLDPAVDADGHGSIDDVLLHQLQVILPRLVGDPVQPGAILGARGVAVGAEDSVRGRCHVRAAHACQRPQRERRCQTEHG
mmetsp:Transcript_48346/g.149352  ORF Transcript_48346/g.149352 Transcript_48346/m.149352 type:complete len:319 (+) Transcript_48346:264-1220(+)